MPCSHCHCFTAAWVIGPKYPVGVGKLLYELYKNCWSAVTDAPVLPSDSEGQVAATAYGETTATKRASAADASAKETVRDFITEMVSRTNVCVDAECYFSEFRMAIIALSALASWESICAFADAIEEKPAAFLSAGPCVPWNSGLLMKLWSTASRLMPPCN